MPFSVAGTMHGNAQPIMRRKRNGPMKVVLTRRAPCSRLAGLRSCLLPRIYEAVKCGQEHFSGRRFLAFSAYARIFEPSAIYS